MRNKKLTRLKGWPTSFPGVLSYSSESTRGRCCPLEKKNGVNTEVQLVWLGKEVVLEPSSGGVDYWLLEGILKSLWVQCHRLQRRKSEIIWKGSANNDCEICYRKLLWTSGENGLRETRKGKKNIWLESDTWWRRRNYRKWLQPHNRKTKEHKTRLFESSCIWHSEWERENNYWALMI